VNRRPTIRIIASFIFGPYAASERRELRHDPGPFSCPRAAPSRATGEGCADSKPRNRAAPRVDDTDLMQGVRLGEAGRPCLAMPRRPPSKASLVAADMHDRIGRWHRSVASHNDVRDLAPLLFPYRVIASTSMI